MKKAIYILFILGILITSCQPKPKTVSLDPQTAKEELTKTLDKMYLAYANKDAAGLTAFLADSGLYLGTDPGEFWDKTAYVKLLTQMFADPSYSGKITVDKREMRVATDGNSAFVIDQFVSFWIKTIAVRHIYHFVKTGNNWICDFSSMALIPKNEDLQKISQSLSQ